MVKTTALLLEKNKRKKMLRQFDKSITFGRNGDLLAWIAYVQNDHYFLEHFLSQQYLFLFYEQFQFGHRTSECQKLPISYIGTILTLWYVKSASLIAKKKCGTYDT